MFKKLRAWLAENRQWREDHDRAWGGPGTPGADGLTPFQRETERRVVAVLQAHGAEPVEHEAQGDDERYILLTLPAPRVKLFIYLDSAEIVGPEVEFRLECWDARTPGELSERLTDRLDQLLREAS